MPKNTYLKMAFSFKTHQHSQTWCKYYLQSFLLAASAKDLHTHKCEFSWKSHLFFKLKAGRITGSCLEA